MFSILNKVFTNAIGHDLKYGQLLTKGAFGSFLLKVGSTGLVFLSQILLSRIIGPSSYGKFIYAYSWIAIFSTVGMMGLATASNRYVSEYHSNDKYGLLKGFIQFSLRTVTISSIVISICILSYCWFNINKIDTELNYTFVILSIILPLLSFLQLKESHLNAIKRVIVGQIARTIVRPSIFILGIFLGFQIFGMTKYAYDAMLINLLAFLLSAVVIMVISGKVLRISAQVKKVFKRREWFFTAKDMFLISGFSLLLFQVDTIMIGMMVGTTEAGIYAAASKIADLLVFVLIAVNTIFSPIVAELYSKGEIKELNSIYVFTTRIVIIGSLIGSIILLTFGDWGLEFYGEPFTSGYIYLKILIVGQFINAFVGPTGVLINMSGHHSDAVKILSVGSVMNILLNWLFIKYFGVIGAAYATAMMNILTNCIFALQVWRKLKIIPLPFNFNK